MWRTGNVFTQFRPQKIVSPAIAGASSSATRDLFIQALDFPQFAGASSLAVRDPFVLAFRNLPLRQPALVHLPLNYRPGCWDILNNAAHRSTFRAGYGEINPVCPNPLTRESDETYQY